MACCCGIEVCCCPGTPLPFTLNMSIEDDFGPCDANASLIYDPTFDPGNLFPGFFCPNPLPGGASVHAAWRAGGVGVNGCSYSFLLICYSLAPDPECYFVLIPLNETLDECSDFITGGIASCDPLEVNFTGTGLPSAFICDPDDPCGDPGIPALGPSRIVVTE